MTAPLVGRDAELGLLHGALTAAAAGRAGAVLVEGEPGVGKSALLSRLALERGPGRPARLRALELRPPAEGRYDPLADAARTLSSVRRYAALARRRRQTGDAGALLAEWLGAIPGWGEVAGAVAETVDVVAKRRLALPPSIRDDEPLAAIVRAARRRPLLLLLDDLHLADEAAVRRLHTLVESAPAGTRLLVVVAYRPPPAGTAPPPVHLLRGSLDRERVQHLALRPLAPAAVGEWARRVFKGADVPGEVIERVHQLTGGYPSELVRLRDTGSLAPEGTVLMLDDGAAANLAGPGEELAAVERLGPGVASILRRAGAFPGAFTTAELARRLGQDEVALEEPLSLAAHYGVLESQGEVDGPDGLPTTRYRFRSVRLRGALVRMAPGPGISPTEALRAE